MKMKCGNINYENAINRYKKGLLFPDYQCADKKSNILFIAFIVIKDYDIFNNNERYPESNGEPKSRDESFEIIQLEKG